MSPPTDLALTAEDLRTVTRFALASAEEVIEIFERRAPEDVRPRQALDAARAFASGAPRGKLQRIASIQAHRAAREATDEAATHAARAAGDAAASHTCTPSPRPLRWATYPLAPTGTTPVARLMATLDADLRASRER